MRLRLYYQGPFYARIDRGQAVAYVVSGALVTLSDYGSFTLCFSVFNAGLLTATVIAYVVGLVVSYVLNRYWVYRKGAENQSEATGIWRYGVFLAVNLAITYGGLWAMQQAFDISPYIGKIIINLFMFFWIYLGNEFWVFKGEREGPIQL
jgi:putative flippase GtrA